MTDVHYYIVEDVAQSREIRGGQTNEDVLTLPIVDGPYETVDEAVDNIGPAHTTSTEGYSVVSVHESDEPEEPASLE